MTPGRRRALAIAAAIALGALIVHNVVWAVVNQLELPCHVRVCVKSRDLTRVAAGSDNPKISSVLANVYWLESRLAGAALTIPPWLDKHRWELERIARLRVAVAPERTIISDDAAAALARTRTSKRRWLRRGGSRARWLFQDLYVEVTPGATTYVVVETRADYGPVFVVSVERLEALR